ncbi:MAG: NAD(P)-dependent oxidoreductase, partial [Calditrichaeota bacterium]
DFVYVDDFSMAIKLALETSINGIFNIGTGTGITIKQVAELIEQKMHVFNKLNLGALPYRENELWNYALYYDRLHQAVGWSPLIGIAIGIELILQEFQR